MSRRLCGRFFKIDKKSVTGLQKSKRAKELKCRRAEVRKFRTAKV